MKSVIVSSSFDNLSSRDMRFLEEASQLGELHVLLWSDEAVRSITGAEPKFPLAEREYFLQAVRYVTKVHFSEAALDPDSLPDIQGFRPDVWCVDEQGASAEKQTYCAAHGIEYSLLTAEQTAGYPVPAPLPASGKKKVVVTGCYDWFHTGHVRFFEEVSELGDLYVVVGHDENIRLLKGDGHPMFKEDERRYLAGSLRYVTQALVSSGTGWMDAEPEIETIKPDQYAVNQDGDKPEKREFCKQHGIEYVVLERTPKPGLTPRSSTDLRGF
ncbi:adenylyltransferase/cytidyltransferase family protein [Novipirellula artificiosorum]|uniref:Bifunctional protein HldE n=1 Tax=Novipirellula artificiosorum TaxID=2528016 RepID=A0A5C6DRX8_9BACT|nr:adenylyltransferase/cytidyltransferase family protein [Novipirellula artificiosorum]TWU39590.1 Bifunctional protein HldE [Novipirellula artificiosorum]